MKIRIKKVPQQVELNASKWHGLGGHLFDGESEETQYLNNSKGFYNFDRENGTIQLPWNTPLRYRMADRREADVVDLRQNRPTFTDWVKEIPANFISGITFGHDEFVPEVLKTDRMKYVDYLNNKYDLQGDKRIKYNDGHAYEAERQRRPWSKEVGFNRHGLGGNLFDDGGETDEEYYPIWIYADK